MNDSLVEGAFKGLGFPDISPNFSTYALQELKKVHPINLNLQVGNLTSVYARRGDSSDGFEVVSRRIDRNEFLPSTLLLPPNRFAITE